MPIYEFKCNECGEQFSEMRKMGDAQGVICPNCTSTNVKKKMSVFASISSKPLPGCASASSCGHAGSGG